MAQEHTGGDTRQHDCVVKRKYPSDSPAVEMAKALRIIPCVDQNTCNEKAGEYKEQVHAAPTPTHEASKPAENCRRLGQHFQVLKVHREHENYGDTTDSVKRINVPAIVRAVNGRFQAPPVEKKAKSA